MPNNLYTVADICKLTGLESSSVRRYAASHNLGTVLSGKVRIFTAQELEQMKHRRKAGRPPKFKQVTPE